MTRRHPQAAHRCIWLMLLTGLGLLGCEQSEVPQRTPTTAAPAERAGPNRVSSDSGSGQSVVPAAASQRADAEPRRGSRDIRRLVFRAETRTEGDPPWQVVSTVTATNPTEEVVTFEYGDCSLTLRAYRTAEREGEPVWRYDRSSDRAAPEIEDGVAMSRVCLDYLGLAEVAPGEVFSPPPFQLQIALSRFFGDSLPDGRYYFTAELELLDRTKPVQTWADTLRLPAGSLHLRALRP